MENKFRFSKSQRLTSSLALQKLFKSKSVIKQYPLLFQYYTTSEGDGHVVVPVVSKRKFRKAVDRNRIKRQIREVFRLNQHLIQIPIGLNLHFAIINMADKKLAYQEYNTAFLSFVKKINETA